MPSVKTPAYVLSGDTLIFNPVPMAGRAGAPMGPGGRPGGVPVSAHGPLAAVVDRNNGVVLRHGPGHQVEAWIAAAWWKSMPYTANVVTLHFPITEVGIETINALLKTAFLSGRLLWRAGPGEKPRRR